MIPTPKHVAIIMDGNGRWAAKRYMPRLAGHRAGTNNISKVVEALAIRGIKYLTIYAFSTENWNRSDSEVTGLMSILEDVIETQTNILHDKGVKIKHIGRIDRISESLSRSIKKAEDITRNNEALILNVAFDYGGRSEIVDAIRKLISDGINYEQIDEEQVSKYLYTNGIPDPDLIIRTAGELRLSNFLLWQSAYSEYYCTQTLWPDFDEDDIDEALEAYSSRQRRFGGRS
ncbi:MAG: polyprenyl diphosphate synthase [Dehalococcoidia bacterium]|nr:polyprenyl diphosphate synthase [Dehalococcoidia bacterium]MQF99238.1 di-trans,poly-cis-decaprenylcistransferase [SAR202 cluster bacterium]|tara:strand:- start:72 stop:764 length:693 start_codon:yes stop_codon:yes gene_type:complete